LILVWYVQSLPVDRRRRRRRRRRRSRRRRSISRAHPIALKAGRVAAKSLRKLSSRILGAISFNI
jgi:hypothetical protein